MGTRRSHRRIVVFGGAGDLSVRYLLPALGDLLSARLIGHDMTIVGVTRHRWSDDDYRRHVETRAEEVGTSRRVQDLLPRLEHRRGDATDPQRVAAVAGPAPVVAYLALPTHVLEPATEAMARGLARGSRVVIEKPFGSDRTSARRLNEILHRRFAEHDIYRVDHFLHKQTLQNIIGLRFGNRLFGPAWSAAHVERVEITWDERMRVGGRGAYYDQAGALRDMLQNHLLLVLTLIAMEQPATADQRELRDRRLEALRCVKTPSLPSIRAKTARARYTGGTIDGAAVPSYVDEPGVDPDRGTETFASVTLELRNDRWDGVPFVLRTGKALARDRRCATIFLRRPIGPLVEDLQGDSIRFEMDPDRLVMDVNLGWDPQLQDGRTHLEASFQPQELPPYSSVLLDVLQGDTSLSIGGDEAEEAWKIMDPILAAWADDAVPLKEYEAGSDGPPGADTSTPR